MTINLQISDTVYRRLLAGHGRIQGTIGLVSPTEGNFNEHVRQATYSEAYPFTFRQLIRV